MDGPRLAVRADGSRYMGWAGLGWAAYTTRWRSAGRIGKPFRAFHRVDWHLWWHARIVSHPKLRTGMDMIGTMTMVNTIGLELKCRPRMCSAGTHSIDGNTARRRAKQWNDEP